jgi:hypothetical protein
MNVTFLRQFLGFYFLKYHFIWFMNEVPPYRKISYLALAQKFVIQFTTSPIVLRCPTF